MQPRFPRYLSAEHANTAARLPDFQRREVRQRCPEPGTPQDDVCLDLLAVFPHHGVVRDVVEHPQAVEHTASFCIGDLWRQTKTGHTNDALRRQPLTHTLLDQGDRGAAGLFGGGGTHAISAHGG